MTRRPSVAVVWRGDDEARRAGIASNERLRPVFAALVDAGIDARQIIHRDEIAAETSAALADADGVVVWVDPIGPSEDRRCLDAILREVIAGGTWVSAHPDVIAVMGTKEVLFQTRHLGWGSDVHRYATFGELRHGLPSRLATGPRVLKPRRGNGGVGVWKVELADAADTVTNPTVLVQGAALRDTQVEEVTLDDVIQRCAPHFAHDGSVIDQAFQPRVTEGMIRCYLVADHVVGFARQSADSLLGEPGAETRIMGIPSLKTMYPPDAPDLARLRGLVERDWVPAMRAVLGLTVRDLPVLWDADFLLGPRTDTGDDSYVLCEINCSCVTPFPPAVPAVLAATVADRLAEHGSAR